MLNKYTIGDYINEDNRRKESSNMEKIKTVVLITILISNLALICYGIYTDDTPKKEPIKINLKK